MTNQTQTEILDSMLSAMLASRQNGGHIHPNRRGPINAAEQRVLADVVRHEGPGISIPEGVSIPDAIFSLKQRMEYEESDVTVVERIPLLPYDGAAILGQLLEEHFGNGVLVQKIPAKSLFKPEQPPQLVTIETGPGPDDKVKAPWGRFTVEGIEGYLETSAAPTSDGDFIFCVEAKVKRRDEPKVQRILADVRARMATHSIYRGKAFRVNFYDSDGDRQRIPAITFIDTKAISDDDLVYSAQVRRDIDASIFTPIEAAPTMRRFGLPAKRGILLHGPYGTGKTLAAFSAARRAVQAGMTFIYLEDSGNVPEAIRFAKTYGPCVLFAEDIDREVEGDDRDDEVNAILNSLDGVDTKGAELIVVFTTNHIEKINPALLRPGRLDAVIHVDAPDAEAARALVERYARGLLAEDIDLGMVGAAVAGCIPAVIREVVERSKLYAVLQALEGEPTASIGAITLTTAALLSAADAVKSQNDAANRVVESDETPGGLIERGLRQVIDEVGDDVKVVRDDVKVVRDDVKVVRDDVKVVRANL